MSADKLALEQQIDSIFRAERRRVLVILSRLLGDIDMAEEAMDLVLTAFLSGRAGMYAIQAAMASAHACAPPVEVTTWRGIVRYYDVLTEIQPTPFVALNRAIAVSNTDDPRVALPFIGRAPGSGRRSTIGQIRGTEPALEVAMQFLVYLARKEGEAMNPPSQEGMAKMGTLMEESVRSGLVVSTGQLETPATYVRLQSGNVELTDGPFIEGKELIPGFTVIQVDTRQAAIDWAARLRECMGDGEIRVVKLATGTTTETM